MQNNNLFVKGIRYCKVNGPIKTFKVMINKFIIFSRRKANKKNNINNEDFNKEVIEPREAKSIHILALVPFYDIGGGQRSAQLAKTFNKLGYVVNYIFPYDSTDVTKSTMEIPCRIHSHIKDIKIEEFEKYVKQDDIFIFEGPVKDFFPYIELAKKYNCKTIYENIDNWETDIGKRFFDKPIVKEFLEKCDILIATSMPLKEQLEDYQKEFDIPKKEVYYLANAVDDDLFNPRLKYEKPKDIHTGTKTLTYYGSLWGDWLDWDLLIEIGNKLPDIAINLIGDKTNLEDKIKKCPKNIHFLGLKPHKQLPAYLYYSDIAMIPRKVGDFGKFISPLKIFEYIAMNKIILAEPMPDIKGYPNTYLSDKAEDWIKVITQDIIGDYSLRDDFISQNNWYSRCDKMLDLCLTDKDNEIIEKEKGNVSVVVLNYNNDKIIQRCVETLLRYKTRYDYEIVVVDNQSSDGSYEDVKQKYGDKINLVKNDKNGCACGRNLGVKSSKGSIIIFLDSDQWVTNEHWLDVYLKIIQDKSIGAIGWGGGWFDNDGYVLDRVDHFPNRSMPLMGLYRKDIGHLETCGFMIRREVFDKTSGLDEAYDPTGYEDTDLSVQVRNLSLEIVFCPFLGVGHIPHQTTKSGETGYFKLLKKNGEYFVNKWRKTNPDVLEYKTKKD